MSAATAFCVWSTVQLWLPLKCCFTGCPGWLWPHGCCRFPHGAIPRRRKGTSANPDSCRPSLRPRGRPLPRILLFSRPLCSPSLCPPHPSLTPFLPPGVGGGEKTVPASLTWPMAIPASPGRFLLSSRLTQRPPWQQKAGDAPFQPPRPRPDITFSLLILGSPGPQTIPGLALRPSFQ